MTRLPDGRYVDDAPYDPAASIQLLERRDLDKIQARFGSSCKRLISRDNS